MVFIIYYPPGSDLNYKHNTTILLRFLLYLCRIFLVNNLASGGRGAFFAPLPKGCGVAEKWNTAAVCHGGAAGVALCRPGGEWYGKVPPGEMGRGDAPKGRGVGMVHKENEMC